MTDALVTAQRLRELLDYDPATGLFRWRIRGKSRPHGWFAGSTTHHGYLVIKVDYRQYRAHRLAWLHTHGVWPSPCVDHADGCVWNNRLENLRLATHQQNAWNMPVHRDAASGLKGAFAEGRSGRWRSRITIGGKRLELGQFDSPEKAAAAYQQAADQSRGEFARRQMVSRSPAPAPAR